MFLINKHTGEAIEWERNITYKVGKTYKSLKEFLEDWEDATVISTRELALVSLGLCKTSRENSVVAKNEDEENSFYQRNDTGTEKAV